MRCEAGWLLFLAAIVCGLSAPARAADEEETTPVETVTGEEQPKAEETPPKAPVSEEEHAKRLAWEVNGYVSEQLTYIVGGGNYNWDSYTDVFADGTWHGGDRPLHFVFNGRLIGDYPGHPDSAIPDYWSTFGDAFQFALYEAYVDIPNLTEADLSLRVGRQYLQEDVWFNFDGLRLDGKLPNVLKGSDFSILGGVPVFYDGSSWSDKWCVGGVFRSKVADKTRVRVTYVHMAENFAGINDPIIDPLMQPNPLPAGWIDDDLLGFSLWQDLPENLKLFARFTFLNWDANELEVRLRWLSADGKWTALLDYYELLQRLVNVTTPISPFVPMMGVYEPFLRFTGRVTWRPDDLWIVQGGLAFRALIDDKDFGPFNHEFTNYFFTVTRVDAWRPGLDLSLTVNGYATENDFFVVTASGDYRLDTQWLLSAGIDYALYKYLWFQSTEHEDVWTYFLRARWDSKDKKFTVTGDFTIDDDRYATYTSLQIKVTVRF